MIPELGHTACLRPGSTWAVRLDPRHKEALATAVRAVGIGPWLGRMRGAVCSHVAPVHWDSCSWGAAVECLPVPPCPVRVCLFSFSSTHAPWLLAHKIQSPQEKEALYALTVSLICFVLML